MSFKKQKKNRPQGGGHAALWIGLAGGVVVLGFCCIGLGVGGYFLLARKTPEKNHDRGGWQVDTSAELNNEPNEFVMSMSTIEFRADGTMLQSGFGIPVTTKQWKTRQDRRRHRERRYQRPWRCRRHPCDGHRDRQRSYQLPYLDDRIPACFSSGASGAAKSPCAIWQHVPLTPRPLSPQAGRGEKDRRPRFPPSPRLRGEGSGVRGEGRGTMGSTVDSRTFDCLPPRAAQVGRNTVNR